MDCVPLQSVSDKHATRSRKTLNSSSFEQNAAQSKSRAKEPTNWALRVINKQQQQQQQQQLIYTQYNLLN